MNRTDIPIRDVRRNSLIVPRLMLPAPAMQGRVVGVVKIGMAALCLNRTDWELAAAFSRVAACEGGTK